MSTCSIRDKDHQECHCGDTHWCESPVIKKNVNSCSDGCNTISTTSITNSDQINQYVCGLQDEHCGHSEHNLCRTIGDISKSQSTCCTPPIAGNSCNCDDSNHHMYYEDCVTDRKVCCPNDYIITLANRVRGRLNHKCRTYGNVKEFIKELPKANIYITNHEFIDLLIDEITDCLPYYNMSMELVAKVKKYVDLYYVYYRNLELIGSLVVNDIVPISKNIIMGEEEANRTKTILYALYARLQGEIYAYEQ